MSVTIYDPKTVGSQAAVFVKVTPSDAATVASATYTITRDKDATGYVWDPGGACIVNNTSDGIILSTPDLISFARVDTYNVLFSITWMDGSIDNSVLVEVPVQNPGGGCC